MKHVFWMWVFLGVGCYKPMTREAWKAECVAHPYYTYYTAYEAAQKEWELQGPLGGMYDGDSNRCSPVAMIQLWDSPDPDVQYTLHALKDMTGETSFAGVDERLDYLEVLDFRPYPEIRDLRPLLSRNTEVTKVIHLPAGAQVHSLWALQRELEVLDAPGVTITGTRPEDCPTEEIIAMNNAAPPGFYPESVIAFCKQRQQRRALDAK
ncbi:MAG: hypothetical protein OXT67_07950 [Zetaproteobacteria bacterium]|nr:hypothetical protein [Zetaproteobacteria bacterium]